jgi:hypothetical protein
VQSSDPVWLSLAEYEAEQTRTRVQADFSSKPRQSSTQINLFFEGYGHFDESSLAGTLVEGGFQTTFADWVSRRKPIGQILSRTSRVALLASPGGGKTTLLKRLAVAYAFPNRRKAGADSLPDRNWFPLFVRCRDLGPAVKHPILSILYGIAERSEVETELTDAFRKLVSDSLHQGTALLLVDGLDEIASEGERVSFASNLRTFLGTYPSVSLIVTSREAGFRSVAGALRDVCERFKIADFSPQDISSLVQAWHREVYGESTSGRQAAQALAQVILENDRIRRLAGNPLLLSTLLLVKRWVGQLPTKRTLLYEKAIEVLLMTWNVQAHDPIGLDDALPRLEFIAFTMMAEGLQSITESRLRSLLKEARQALPEALCFSAISDNEFVDRVELRSSILINAGHKEEDGRLIRLYEFRHLTFQEYLAALALKEGNHSRRKESDSPIDILKTYLDQDSWREIVPLTAVLMGRDAKDIVLELIGRISSSDRDQWAIDSGEEIVHVRLLRRFNHEGKSRLMRPSRGEHYMLMLAQCLMDEVQLAPSVAEQGFKTLVQNLPSILTTSSRRILGSLMKSRLGGVLRQVIDQGLQELSNHSLAYGHATADMIMLQLEQTELSPSAQIEALRGMLSGADQLGQTRGAWASGFLLRRIKPEAFSQELGIIEEQLVALLGSSAQAVQLAACQTLPDFIARGLKPKHIPQLIIRIAKLWCEADDALLHRSAARTLWSLPIVPRSKVDLSSVGPTLKEKTVKALSNTRLLDWDAERLAAITAAYYSEIIPASELIGRLGGYLHTVSRGGIRSWAESILIQLGPEGEAKLNALALTIAAKHGVDPENDPN